MSEPLAPQIFWMWPSSSRASSTSVTQKPGQPERADVLRDLRRGLQHQVGDVAALRGQQVLREHRLEVVRASLSETP